jgi:hypothetical protein
MTAPLKVDRGQIEAFTDAMFRYASQGQTIAIRSFLEGDTKRLFSAKPVKVNGAGLVPVIETAVREAQLAADFDKAVVFCPPTAGFLNEVEPWRAREQDLNEAFALSVECDQQPERARTILEGLLGPATVVVASGGEWIDPATGEVQPKLHLHWRLNEPATGDDLARLKQARRFAMMVAGGDPSNVPMVHPIRWPGTWHRKKAPRLASIEVLNAEAEIELTAALDVLQSSAPEPKAEPRGSSETRESRNDDRTTAELIQGIVSGDALHPSIVPLAARLLGNGMYPGAAVNFIRSLLEQIPAEKRDFRWQLRFDDVPRVVETAETKYGANQPGTGNAEIEPVDLWGRFDPPPLPTGLLPGVIEDFARVQGKLMGADPSGLAAAALAVCAAAIPDRIKVQVKRHDPTWQEAPRLWVALIGNPSTKKSPILSAAVKPLTRIDAALYREWADTRAAYEALSKDEQKLTRPPRQTRLRIEDTTIEAAQEVLRDSPDGVLCLQDELSGWFGAMDKYSGARGAAKDRSFWLQSFNGGAYAINRVGRGAGLIENVSVSMLGGIQPEPMRKIASDSVDDGLLQRLFPIILRPATVGLDAPMPDVVGRYGRLVESLHKLAGVAPAQDDISPVLHFDDRAQEIRRSLEERHLELMATEAVNRKLAAHVGKLDGLFARLCVVWHCVEHAEARTLPKVIEEHTADRVAKFLHGFLLRHAFAFYAGTLGLSDDHDRLTAVAGYILAHKLEVMTNRDVQRGDRTMRGIERQSIARIFEQLEALGWVNAEPGRRATDPPRWVVNPIVHQRYVARAADERKRRQAAHVMIAELASGGGSDG